MIITINNLERNTADDTVVIAHWVSRVEETHNEPLDSPDIDKDGNTITEHTVVDYSASAYGTQSFTRDENSPAFIPFEDLTEEVVVGWLELNEGLEANLQAQIDEQKTPTTVSGVPWNNPVAEAA